MPALLKPTIATAAASFPGAKPGMQPKPFRAAKAARAARAARAAKSVKAAKAANTTIHHSLAAHHNLPQQNNYFDQNLLDQGHLSCHTHPVRSGNGSHIGSINSQHRPQRPIMFGQIIKQIGQHYAAQQKQESQDSVDRIMGIGQINTKGVPHTHAVLGRDRHFVSPKRNVKNNDVVLRAVVGEARRHHLFGLIGTSVLCGTALVMWLNGGSQATIAHAGGRAGGHAREDGPRGS